MCAAQGKHGREINLGQLMREEYGQRVRRPMLGLSRAPDVVRASCLHACLRRKHSPMFLSEKHISCLKSTFWSASCIRIFLFGYVG